MDLTGENQVYLALQLYDASQTLLAQGAGTGTRHVGLAWAAPAGTYAVRISPVDRVQVPYTLWVSTSPPGPDGNDSFDTATPLVSSAAVAGQLPALWDEDFYAFTVTGPGSVSVQLTDYTADLDVRLHDGSRVAFASGQSPTTTPALVTFQAPGAGTYSFQVLACDGYFSRFAATSYQLRATYTP